MKIGVQLPEVERVTRWTELRTMAEAAERIGLDSVWVGEHLLYRYADGEERGPWEAWSLMAALAAATTRVEIGPLVACTSFHNPAVLAKQAATLDEISGGRLILGLGAGWNEVEYRAFGVPYDRRVSRFAEAFTIIRSLLRDGQVDFAGDYYAARDCILLPRGPRPNGPPLMVGSMGSRMLQITLPYVDAWNAWHNWFGNRVEGYRPMRDAVDAACEEVGRDPATLERTVALFVAFPDAVGRKTAADDAVVEPLPSEPAPRAEHLAAFADAGVAHVQLVLDPITVESIERLAPVLQEFRGGRRAE
jgi:alkanesulfonate monooxygenase SsuD/methylene tetrahydromethanopterin reductase-like flavin-dependent oxidoreductase (luciferase family)